MKPSWYSKWFVRSAIVDVSETRARALAGDAEAQFEMGVNCRAMLDGAEDSGEAAAWFRKAADQNYAPAQYQLGILYAEGRGLPRDDAEALSWLRKAAYQGHIQAQFSLGMRCRRSMFRRAGLDGSESRIEAYKWLLLAANQGSKESVAAWEQVALDMSSEEVAEANHRTDQFALSSPGPLAA